MDVLKKLGDNIRQLRKEINVSQEQLAFNSGLHRTYIGSIERGEKNVAFKNLCKIAKALNTTVSELTINVK